MEVNQILHGDVISKAFNGNCEIGMQDWPDNYFGLAVPDPPYFNGPQKKKYYGHSISPINVKRINYTPIKNWDIPTDMFFEQLFRVSDNSIIWGGNYYPQLGKVHATPRREKLQEWIAEHPVGWIVWDKCNGVTDFNDFELAWTSFDRPTIVFEFLWNGMMQGKSLSYPTVMQGNKKLNQKRIHQTQKPLEIYQWQFINYGDISKPILDTHLGSQSSRIVAYKMGFDFVGYELDKHVFNIGNERFKELTRLPLFENTPA